MQARVIAIDGPSGSGKSTVAKRLSSELGLTYLDTGAMFRAIAIKLAATGIDFSKETLTEDEIKTVEELLSNMDFKYALNEKVLVQIDGVDLTSKIREHEVSILTSNVSKFPVVRNYLKHFQRKIASKRPSILEGRDIGTVIFPNAILKFFLTASDRARALRRYEQLVAKDPSYQNKLDIEQIERDLKERDAQDSGRKTAPLKKADDAIEIDTTKLSLDEVCQEIKSIFKDKVALFH